VVVFNVAAQKVLGVIEAHQSPLAALVLSPGGRYLATASVKGTLIRVFDVSQTQALLNGTTKEQIVATFRRGVTSSVVTTMRFNANSSLLCCGSKNGTVHVFDVNAVVDPEHSVSIQASKSAAAANTSTASTAIAASKSLFSGLIETLPTAISSHRSVCSVAVGAEVASFVCGFVSMSSDGGGGGGGGGEVKTDKKGVDSSSSSKEDCIVVVTSTGIVSIYSMDFISGTTVLQNQHLLVENAKQQESSITEGTIK